MHQHHSDRPQPRRARRSAEGLASDQAPGAGHYPDPQAPAAQLSPEEVAARKRRRKSIALWFLTSVAVVVIATVVMAGLYLNRLSTDFNEQRNVIDVELGEDTVERTNDDTLNILLLGSDSRGDVDSSYRTEIGDVEGERSDTMMLVHIPADRSGVYVMSIVRDLWVDIPGLGQERVNAALGAGGYDLVIDTVEDLLDTHIDHVAIINFDGFSDLTSALDGVYIDNPRAFSSGQQNPAFFPEGRIRLSGVDALRFVRERKTFPTGDYIRVENQQLVVRAIMTRFLSAETLTNPQRVLDVVNGIVPYLTMDEGLDASTVAGYAFSLRDLRSDDIEMFTVPTGEMATTAAGAQVILQDPEAMEALRAALRDETMSSYLEETHDPDQGQEMDPEYEEDLGQTDNESVELE